MRTTMVKACHDARPVRLLEPPREAVTNISHIVTAWETFAQTTAPDLVLAVSRTEAQYEALVAFADKLTSTTNCNDPEHAPLYDLVAFYIGEWENVHDADILEGEVPPHRMLAYYLEQRGVSAYWVAKDTGIPQPTSMVHLNISVRITVLSSALQQLEIG